MSEQPVLEPPTPRRIRAELEGLVVGDLYGPTDGDPFEGLPSSERPGDRYILGRLAPNGALIRPEEQDGMAEASLSDSSFAADPVAEGENGAAEPEAPAAPSMFCSAHGFTVCVEPDVTRLYARASWARYVDEPDPDPEKGGRIRRREPREGEAEIPVGRDGGFGPVELDPAQPGVCVRGRVRTYGATRLVTVFLVNAQRGEARDQGLWLFQAELALTAADGAAPVFLPRPESFAGGDKSDAEEQARLAMNYRFAAEFAVGHSVAVDVETAPGDPMRAVAVRTAAVPGYELAATDVPSATEDHDLPELADLVVDMKALAAIDAATVRSAIGSLVTGYRAWIQRQRERIGEPGAHLDGYRAEARRNLKDAASAADRIDRAITVLENDPDSLAAFRFANRAMHLQRIHSLAAQRRDTDGPDGVEELAEPLDTPQNRSWRPFQIAFVLLTLPSATDPAPPARANHDTPAADPPGVPTRAGRAGA